MGSGTTLARLTSSVPSGQTAVRLGASFIDTADYYENAPAYGTACSIALLPFWQPRSSMLLPFCSTQLLSYPACAAACDATSPAVTHPLSAPPWIQLPMFLTRWHPSPHVDRLVPRQRRMGTDVSS